MTETKRIENLYQYLMRKCFSPNPPKEIIVRTTLVKGGWHSNEFDAHAAGFQISRFFNPEYEARHEFSECYRLTLRETK